MQKLTRVALTVFLMPIAASASVLWNGFGAIFHCLDAEKVRLFAKALFEDLLAAGKTLINLLAVTKKEIDPPPAIISDSEKEINPPPAVISDSEKKINPPPAEISDTKKEINPPPAVISDSEKEINPPPAVSDSEKEINPPPAVSDSEKEINPPPAVISDIKKEINPPPPVISDIKKEISPPPAVISDSEKELDIPLSMTSEREFNFFETPIVFKEPPNIPLEEITVLYNDAETNLAHLYLMHAIPLIYHIKGYAPPFQLDGRIIADHLEGCLKTSLALDETIRQQVADIVQNLQKAQLDIERYRKLYHDAGRRDSPFKLEPQLAYCREFYAEILGSSEFELIKATKELNDQIDLWIPQGIICKKVPYSIPSDGDALVERITTISRNYRDRLKEFLPWFADLSAASMALQKRIDMYRSADAYILRYQKQNRPQPISYLDYMKAIPPIEAEIVNAVQQANLLLSSTITEDKNIEAQVKKSLKSIPFSAPLNGMNAVTHLKSCKELLRTSKSEQKQDYINEIDGIIFLVQKTQGFLDLLRKSHALQAPRGFVQPALYIKVEDYKKIFKGDNLNIITVENILAKFVIEESIDTSRPKEYNEFKTRVLEAKKQLDKSQLDPCSFFGPDVHSEEALNKARKKYLIFLHPDKNGNTTEVNALFSCMSELYNLGIEKLKLV